ncbi:unnamed protein product, partial [Hymenolepis diminuta]
IGRVKPAYLDKRVTENTSPVFHPNPLIKEPEKPILVTRSGRNIPSVSSPTSYGLPKSKIFVLNRTVTLGPIHGQKFVSPLRTSRLGGG